MPTAFGYRPTSRYNLIPSGQPVCVAVTFNTIGQMRIDSFGVEFGGLRYRYKIKSYLLLKEDKGICTFDCTYVDFGLVKTIRLMFYVATCQWMVG
jgi:hypothetical protein